METTEDVSSRGVGKRAERHKSQRAPLCQRKIEAGLEKRLANLGEGRKSRKRPSPVVGKNPNGKDQLIIDRTCENGKIPA
jgi:hypothetical protein